MLRLYACLLLLPLFGASCSSTRQLCRQLARSDVFAQSQTGFYLADAETGRTLFAHNGEKRFVPASNVKILTLAACLEVLGDSLPRFRYAFGEPDSSEPNGLLVICGTGDPTLLHPDFEAWQSKPDFFHNHPWATSILVGAPGSGSLLPYGPGWAWDDFPDDYSTEISDIPVYGNAVRIRWNGEAWSAEPDLFQDSLQWSVEARSVRRAFFNNSITVPPSPTDAADTLVEIPIFGARNFVPVLLEDKIGVDGSALDFEVDPALRMNVCPVDTAYRRMMYRSDNFFAEQLLLLASGEKFDTLHSSRMIRWMLDSVWASLPEPVRWVDGSGLSRYNLLSPQFVGGLLHRLWQQQSRERLFDLFPAGGQEGTLNGWYGRKEGAPYLYAKSGSMSGVYCLSGYLVAKSGRVLVFSIMNNGFVGSNRPWREEIEKVLELVWGRY